MLALMVRIRFRCRFGCFNADDPSMDLFVFLAIHNCFGGNDVALDLVHRGRREVLAHPVVYLLPNVTVTPLAEQSPVVLLEAFGDIRCISDDLRRLLPMPLQEYALAGPRIRSRYRLPARYLGYQ